MAQTCRGGQLKGPRGWRWDWSWWCVCGAEWVDGWACGWMGDAGMSLESGPSSRASVARKFVPTWTLRARIWATRGATCSAIIWASPGPRQGLRLGVACASSKPRLSRAWASRGPRLSIAWASPGPRVDLVWARARLRPGVARPRVGLAEASPDPPRAPNLDILQGQLPPIDLKPLPELTPARGLPTSMSFNACSSSMIHPLGGWKK